MFIHVNLEVMKYLLKQNNEDEGILCDKVAIDGFEYYLENGNVVKPIDFSKWQYSKNANMIFIGEPNILKGEYYEVIATNNPNIDIPKVVDEVELILDLLYPKIQSGNYGFRRREDFRELFAQGYNKYQETHPFSLNDLKSLLDFITNEKTEYSIMYGNQEERFSTIDKDFTIDELINIWKEQQPKIVYYEK